MKGEQAEYNIGLAKAFIYQPKKRIVKAINVIKSFVKKHTRAKEVLISNEVNHFLHRNSKNLPRKVNAVFLKENNSVRVFLQKGKDLESYLKNRDAEKKKKEEKRKEAKEEKKETAEEKEKKQSDEKKLEEKKEMEKAAQAAEMKRK